MVPPDGDTDKDDGIGDLGHHGRDVVSQPEPVLARFPRLEVMENEHVAQRAECESYDPGEIDAHRGTENTFKSGIAFRRPALGDADERKQILPSQGVTNQGEHHEAHDQTGIDRHQRIGAAPDFRDHVGGQIGQPERDRARRDQDNEGAERKALDLDCGDRCKHQRDHEKTDTQEQDKVSAIDGDIPRHGRIEWSVQAEFLSAPIDCHRAYRDSHRIIQTEDRLLKAAARVPSSR